VKAGTATITTGPAARPAGPDRESARWLADLRGPEPARADALGRLRALLVRAAEFEVARRRKDLSASAPEAPRRIAREAAESALAEVLDRLDDFHGGSRFTTWASKFALLEAAVMVRISGWDGYALPSESQAWALLAGWVGQPSDHEVAAALREAIIDALSKEERAVIAALALNGVPIDVLAHRRRTSRGALYETLQTARRRLRTRLGEWGSSP
jgi:RNA polymerase sigma-70 factor (ECF subfamily)